MRQRRQVSSTGNLGLWSHATRWTAARGPGGSGHDGQRKPLQRRKGGQQRGTIVGYADNPNQTAIVPVVWTRSTLSILPTLGGGNAFAEAINEAGDIVGNARTPEGQTHCVI